MYIKKESENKKMEPDDQKSKEVKREQHEHGWVILKQGFVYN
jgi:hypothetical protein